MFPLSTLSSVIVQGNNPAGVQVLRHLCLSHLLLHIHRPDSSLAKVSIRLDWIGCTLLIPDGKLFVISVVFTFIQRLNKQHTNAQKNV